VWASATDPGTDLRSWLESRLGDMKPSPTADPQFAPNSGTLLAIRVPAIERKIDEPFECRLQGPECASSPIDQRHLVLVGWPAAICRARHVSVSPAFKLEHQFDAFLACHNDAVELRTLRESNHGIKDTVRLTGAME
jgi:hypothetical protein